MKRPLRAHRELETLAQRLSRHMLAWTAAISVTSTLFLAASPAMAAEPATLTSQATVSSGKPSAPDVQCQTFGAGAESTVVDLFIAYLDSALPAKASELLGWAMLMRDAIAIAAYPPAAIAQYPYTANLTWAEVEGADHYVAARPYGLDGSWTTTPNDLFSPGTDGRSHGVEPGNSNLGVDHMPEFITLGPGVAVLAYDVYAVSARGVYSDPTQVFVSVVRRSDAPGTNVAASVCGYEVAETVDAAYGPQFTPPQPVVTPAPTVRCDTVTLEAKSFAYLRWSEVTGASWYEARVESLDGTVIKRFDGGAYPEAILRAFGYADLLLSGQLQVRVYAYSADYGWSDGSNPALLTGGFPPGDWYISDLACAPWDGMPQLQAPVLQSCENTDESTAGAARVTWGQVPGADSYEILVGEVSHNVSVGVVDSDVDSFDVLGEAIRVAYFPDSAQQVFVRARKADGSAVTSRPMPIEFQGSEGRYWVSSRCGNLTI